MIKKFLKSFLRNLERELTTRNSCLPACATQNDSESFYLNKSNGKPCTECPVSTESDFCNCTDDDKSLCDSGNALTYMFYTEPNSENSYGTCSFAYNCPSTRGNIEFFAGAIYGKDGNEYPIIKINNSSSSEITEIGCLYITNPNDNLDDTSLIDVCVTVENVGTSLENIQESY
jgi:hypothetical protein